MRVQGIAVEGGLVRLILGDVDLYLHGSTIVGCYLAESNQLHIWIVGPGHESYVGIEALRNAFDNVQGHSASIAIYDAVADALGVK